MTESSLPAGGSPTGKSHRFLTGLVIVALVSVVASTASQAWFTYEVLPQQIHDSEPVIIDQAVLVSDGPFVGCFFGLTAPGALVVHQGESFVLSWTITAPTNATPSCTVQSIDANFGPANVTGSNLPVTILAGQVGYVEVQFAPLNYPYWGGETIRVIETNP
ncbi:MAG: hypothetical protein WA547_07575 [Thermoplasmata archaeon]